MTATARFLGVLVGAGIGVTACSGKAPPPQEPEPAPPTTTAEAPDSPPPVLNQLSRADFNLLAQQSNLPLFWAADQNGDHTVAPDEVGVLWGQGAKRVEWIADGEFSERFLTAYQGLVDLKRDGWSDKGLDDQEKRRRELVLMELSQGRPTLIHSDFRALGEGERALVQNVLEAGVIIERIHARQLGSLELRKKVPASHPPSQAMFFRNQGPWCAAPKTESEADCYATTSKPPKVSGLYPAALQSNSEFCAELKARKDADQLIHQFFVVEGSGKELKAVAYHEHFAAELKLINQKLTAAAGLLGDSEKAFRDYLQAAAKAFLDDSWPDADEAWARMNATNSKWYLRIGPDEVYFEPCSFKAGYHVSFARINQDSLRWQEKLDPVKSDMEKALAKLAGPPYRARKVDFHLPDFIDIVINAGDSRSAHGATIGQSLPNWGPVANEGRGRTVAMTNLYEDPDSKLATESQAKSLLCADTMKHYTRDSEPMTMSTVLHEAAHNLGPAHEYKVRGKTARQIFSGGMASTLEELKAQTAALYLADWLVEKKIIPVELATQAHVRDLVWSFGHISRGMYEADGKKPKPYSQLAAIQLSSLIAEGAIEWKSETVAANQKDKGCFELNLAKYPGAALKLMTQVARIKARGDKRGATSLVADHVDKKGETQDRLKLIRERWLRAPKATFVYSVRLD